jgi:hypothetical protein
LENALGILDRVHVAVVIFDHLDGRTHLLGEEIHINPLRQPEGRVGMPEAIG